MMQFRCLHSEFSDFCLLLWVFPGQNLRQILLSLDSCSHNFIRDSSPVELSILLCILLICPVITFLGTLHQK